MPNMHKCDLDTSLTPQFKLCPSKLDHQSLAAELAWYHGVFSLCSLPLANVKRQCVCRTLYGEIQAKKLNDRVIQNIVNFNFISPATDDAPKKLLDLAGNNSWPLVQPRINFNSIAFFLIDHGFTSVQNNSLRSTVLEYLCSRDSKWIRTRWYSRQKLLSIIRRFTPFDDINVNEASKTSSGNKYLNLMVTQLRIASYAIPHLRTKIAIELICILILKGIDASATSVHGLNILKLLLRNYQPAVGPLMLKLVRLLIGRGVDLNEVGWGNEDTALNCLCARPIRYDASFVELVQLLIKNGVDINHMDCIGSTALIQVLDFYERPMSPYVFSVVSLLVNHGANINSINYALYLFCNDEKGDLTQVVAMIRLLIKAGADVHSSRYGPTYGSALARLLKSYFIDKCEKENKCSNPVTTLDEARCWLQIVQLFYENRTTVNENDVASVLKELSIICRFYDGPNLLDIADLVLKHVLSVNAQYPSLFTPESLSYPFIEFLENTFQNHVRFQMYQLFSRHMIIEHLPSTACLYRLMDASINRSSRNKRKSPIDVFCDIERGKKRRMF